MLAVTVGHVGIRKLKTLHMVNIKLNKKELEWLKSWLEEDLDLAIENDHGKLVVKNLKHILKKLNEH